MSRRKSFSIVMLAACGLALMATGAFAELVQTNSTADPGYQYIPSSVDLINQGEASLDHVVWAGYENPPYEASSLSVMNDGTAGNVNVFAGTAVTMDGRTPSGFFFLKGSNAGYDVTEINCYSAWYGPRNMQKFQVFYSLASDPAYVSGNLLHQLVGEFAHSEVLPENRIIGTKISLTDNSGRLLSGVTAVQFKFLDATGSDDGDPNSPTRINRTAYREIDVIGSATVPEPSAIALLAVGTLSLIAYAWRKRR